MAGPHSIGKIIEVMAPLGEPPVFVRNVDVMHRFIEDLKQRGVIASGDTVSDAGSSVRSSKSLFSSFQRK